MENEYLIYISCKIYKDFNDKVSLLVYVFCQFQLGIGNPIFPRGYEFICFIERLNVFQNWMLVSFPVNHSTITIKLVAEMWNVSPIYGYSFTILGRN